MKEEIEIALLNVSHFKNFEDYASQWHGEFTEGDFKEQLEKYFISDITLSVYNGATQTTHYREINDKNILDAILVDLNEGEYYELLDEIEGCRLINDNDYIQAYTELFNVFTLNGRIYADKD